MWDITSKHEKSTHFSTFHGPWTPFFMFLDTWLRAIVQAKFSDREPDITKRYRDIINIYTLNWYWIVTCEVYYINKVRCKIIYLNVFVWR